MQTSGIHGCRVADTAFAVLDFETTGLTPGSDRVVEVSVVRMERGQEAQLVLDTLVNPARPMAATEIHGITDEDVADAPEFGDIAGDFVRAIAGAVVASYNVYFDIRFLDYELRHAGLACEPPHICLMYLRPMLGLGQRCALEEACRCHGLTYGSAHIASADCTAAADLLRCYLNELRSRQIRTFAELAHLRQYKFVDSFTCDPVDASIAAGRPVHPLLRSRAGAPVRGRPSATRLRKPAASEERTALSSYWAALKTVVEDFEVTDAEIRYLQEKKQRLGLADEQVRVLHARAFAGAIACFVKDQWLDDKEVVALRRLRACLAQLGWAPGD